MEHSLTPAHRARLNELAALRTGWCHGLGDPIPADALAAAAAVLTGWTTREQAAWQLHPTPDGELRLERQDTPRHPQCLWFVDIAADGACTTIWFDTAGHRFTRYHATPAECADALHTLSGHRTAA